MQAYPITYQRETSPAWLNYAAVLGGAPPRASGRFRYLELGCGRGYSTLVHAASHPHGDFHACDRDAEAIAGARSWANKLGLRNVAFHAVGFDGLRDQAPFDMIVAHGVYSWVDDAGRAAVRETLRTKLTPGGLAYVSYNCLPGWSDELPLRKLLSEFSAGTTIPNAVQALNRLKSVNLAFFVQHPAAERAVSSWTEQPSGYLAHEYLAEACVPMWSVDVADEMAALGLTYVASATLRDNHEALLVDEATAGAIAALATPRLRQLAMDFAVNRSFRRDVFVKGASGEANPALRDLAMASYGEIPESILVPRGRITFRPEFIAALRTLMARGPSTLGEAATALGDNPAESARNLLWLVAAGALCPASEGDAAGAEARGKLKAIGVVPS
ncbi:MAG: class I SAM-dependent methyltransferase [Alphaproteobacteria bacterium]|nr:class I SAM-dependent methyltransferase [Alphaproteobacteria bacterium]MBV9904317.1 class I SAM-dependent methyltransferase [Alphaproteobacteria bacterium]